MAYPSNVADGTRIINVPDQMRSVTPIHHGRRTWSPVNDDAMWIDQHVVVFDTVDLTAESSFGPGCSIAPSMPRQRIHHRDPAAMSDRLSGAGCLHRSADSGPALLTYRSDAGMPSPDDEGNRFVARDVEAVTRSNDQGH
jgi:hypothetical protein